MPGCPGKSSGPVRDRQPALIERQAPGRTDLGKQLLGCLSGCRGLAVSFYRCVKNSRRPRAEPRRCSISGTKVLHKKRPKLIPILDDEAIFGAYMNPKWPEKLASTDSVYAKARIARGLRSAHPRVAQATHPVTSPKLGADP